MEDCVLDSTGKERLCPLCNLLNDMFSPQSFYKIQCTNYVICSAKNVQCLSIYCAAPFTGRQVVSADIRYKLYGRNVPIIRTAFR
jgi:hypothetical protein